METNNFEITPDKLIKQKIHSLYKFYSIKDTWPIVYGINDKLDIVKHVYPLQQRTVLNLLNFLEKNISTIVAVKEVYIFGSSITERCTVVSDLDIGFIVEKETEEVDTQIYKLVRECFLEYKDCTEYDIIIIDDNVAENRKTRIYEEIKGGLRLL